VGSGSLQREFVINGDVASRAEFFRRAMNGCWVEAEDRVIHMPEDDPEKMHLYLHFLYTNELSARVVDTTRDGFKTQMRQYYLQLMQVYVLAEKLQDTRTKNALVHKVFDAVYLHEEDERWYLPSSAAVAYLYENTLEGNSMRKLVAAFYTMLAPNTLSVHRDVLPKEFLCDLISALRLAKKERTITALKNTVEQYIEHV
jgi:hypothetical protein